MAKRQYTSTIATAIEQFGQEDKETSSKKVAISKPTQKKKESPKETISSEVEKKESEPIPTQVSKIGRPKGENLKHISLGIPARLFDQISGAALLHDGNKTKYIVSLIEADIEKNGATYSNLANIVNSAKI